MVRSLSKMVLGGKYFKPIREDVRGEGEVDESINRGLEDMRSPKSLESHNNRHNIEWTDTPIYK